MLRDIELFEAIRRDDLSTIISSQYLDIVRNLMIDDLPDMLTNHPSFLMIAAYYGSSNCFNYIFEKSQTLTLSGISYQDVSIFILFFNRESVFHLAAAGGNLEIFKKLAILDHKFFSSRDGFGNTPLHYAAKYGRISIVQYICSLNVDVMIPNASGCLPSHYAAIFGSRPIIQLLHSNGDPMNVINYNRWTPLHYAIKYQHEDVIDYLMNLDDILQPPLNEGTANSESSESSEKKKDEIDQIDKNYPHIAYSDESYDVAASLIQMAATYGSSTLVKVMIEKANGFDSLNHNGWNFLHFAAANGYSNVLKSAHEILKSDDLFLVVDRNKRNLAHLATISCHLDVLVTLKSLNFVLYDKYDKYGISICFLFYKNSLHYACELGYLHLVQYFLQNNSDVQNDLLNSVDAKNHYTALHFAAAKGKLDVVKYLLKFATNESTPQQSTEVKENQESNQQPITENQQESTPVDQDKNNAEEKDENNSTQDIQIDKTENDQSKNQNTETKDSQEIKEPPKAEPNPPANLNAEENSVKFNINATDIFGMTPFYLAVLNNHYEVASLLLENGADPNIQTIDTKRTPIIEATTAGDIRMVELLCSDEKTDIFLADENGWTPVHYAAQLNQDQLIDYFKEIDLKSLNMETNMKQTPFEISIIWNKIEPFSYLIEPENITEIDINHQDIFGNTALHDATKKRNFSMVQSLLKLDKIKLNVKNQQGDSPLHIAIEGWSFDIFAEIALTGDCDLNIRNSQQLTPLLLAAKLGNQKITDFLVEHENVDCQAVDTNGDSALHLAARLRDQTIMRSLINSKRFDLNLQNNFGRKPFEILQIYTKKHKKETDYSDSDSPSINSENENTESDDENQIKDLNEEEEESKHETQASPTTSSSLKTNLKNFFMRILTDSNNDNVYHEYENEECKEEEEEEDLNFELVYDDGHYSKEEEEEEHMDENELESKNEPKDDKEKPKGYREKILEVEFHKNDPDKNLRLNTFNEKDSVGHCGAESDESFDEFQRLEAEAMRINADIPVTLENTNSEPAFNMEQIDINKLQEEIGVDDQSQEEEDKTEIVNVQDNNVESKNE